MWLFTKYGMFSVVLKPNGEFQVRSRAKRHLMLLKARFGLGKKHHVIETLHADYGFRIVVSQAQFASIASALISEIDYDNFKNECHDMSDPAYDRALMATWGVMHRLQMDENPRVYERWPQAPRHEQRPLITDDVWANLPDDIDEPDFIDEEDDEDEVPPTTYPPAPQSWSGRRTIDDAPTDGPFEV